MRIAFCGSMFPAKLQPIVEAIAALPEGSIVVSSNAGGVDRAVIRAALARGLRVEICPSAWESLFRKPLRVDHLYAFPGNWRGNTRRMIQAAVDAGIPVTVEPIDVRRDGAA